MKKFFAILTLVFIGVTYGCNNPAQDENSVVLKGKLLVSSGEGEDQHQHTDSDSIQLNDGAKWKVVPEMMGYIRNMESDINHFAENRNTELKGFLQLGASLQKNIDLLTSSCTMEGKAHDELHKWLLPYIDMVDKLNAAKNFDEAFNTFGEIRTSYIVFNRYFE